MYGDDLMPTVTVALPVLDEERHLEAALASIAAQTYPAHHRSARRRRWIARPHARDRGVVPGSPGAGGRQPGSHPGRRTQRRAPRSARRGVRSRRRPLRARARLRRSLCRYVVEAGRSPRRWGDDTRRAMVACTVESRWRWARASAPVPARFHTRRGAGLGRHRVPRGVSHRAGPAHRWLRRRRRRERGRGVRHPARPARRGLVRARRSGRATRRGATSSALARQFYRYGRSRRAHGPPAPASRSGRGSSPHRRCCSRWRHRGASRSASLYLAGVAARTVFETDARPSQPRPVSPRRCRRCTSRGASASSSGSSTRRRGRRRGAAGQRAVGERSPFDRYPPALAPRGSPLPKPPARTRFSCRAKPHAADVDHRDRCRQVPAREDDAISESQAGQRRDPRPARSSPAGARRHGGRVLDRVAESGQLEREVDLLGRVEERLVVPARGEERRRAGPRTRRRGSTRRGAGPRHRGVGRGTATRTTRRGRRRAGRERRALRARRRRRRRPRSSGRRRRRTPRRRRGRPDVGRRQLDEQVATARDAEIHRLATPDRAGGRARAAAPKPCRRRASRRSTTRGREGVGELRRTIAREDAESRGRFRDRGRGDAESPQDRDVSRGRDLRR